MSDRVPRRIRRGIRRSGLTSPEALTAIGLAAVGLAIGAAVVSTRQEHHRPGDSAPGRTRRGSPRFGGYDVIGRTVTINRPRDELYAFWRDFKNLPKFMENISSVAMTGENRAVWTIAAPAGRTVDVETEVVTDRPGEIIAWRSVAGSQIDTEGRVAFSDAPGGRGTQVEAIVAYKAPGGELGRLVAKLFQAEPSIQARRELKRFKMLMETGEIATSENRRCEAA